MSVAFGKLAASFSLILLAGPALAASDWKVENCVASTTAVYAGVNHQLELVVDQTGARPLEIRIKPDAALVPVTLGLKVALDRKATQVYSFAPLASADTPDREIFWNIPRGSEALVSFLKREMKFELTVLDGVPAPVDPKAKVAKLVFSLRGSSKALGELQKTCNANKALGSDGFERAFLPAVVANVDPMKLKAADTAKLRDLVATALQAFKASNQTQAEINTLTAKYVVQIKEYEQLHRNLDKLTHTEIVRLQTKRTEAQATIDQANKEIPELRAQIGANEAMLATANHEVEAAHAIFDPLLPQVRKLQSVVSNAEANLSTAQSNLSAANSYESQTRSRLQDLINAVSTAESNVQSLQSQADSMRYDVSRARSEVDEARREFQNADSRRRSFDRDGEIRSRIGRDSRHGSIDGEIRNRRGRMEEAERERRSAEEERGRSEGEFERCKQDPAADCSRHRGGIDGADQRRRQAEDRCRDMEREIGGLERERNEIRSRIERDVEGECRDLDREKDERARRLRDAEEVLERVERRQRDLVNVEIPNAQNEVSRLRSLRSEAESDVRTAQSDVSSAESNVSSAKRSLESAQSKLYSHKKSVGYAEKKAAVQKAEDHVEDIKKELGHLDREIARREKLIRDETKDLAEIEKQMQAVVATIQQKEARSAEVQKLLEPYTTEHTVLSQKKAASDQAFANAQQAFAQGLPQDLAAAAVAAAQ